MNAQQAYINGFVKKAAEYGLNQYQAVELLKQANPVPTTQTNKLYPQVAPYLVNNPISASEVSAVGSLKPEDSAELDRRIGSTTPAHVLGGIYGRDLGRQITQANQYNKQNGLPTIKPNIFDSTGVYATDSNYTYPAKPILALDLDNENRTPERATARDFNILNGYHPVQPGVNINTPKRRIGDYFSPYNYRHKNNAQHSLEHEASHRIYDYSRIPSEPDSSESRLGGVKIHWPISKDNQPHLSNSGDALNGIAAMQRDQYERTGARHTDPNQFKRSVYDILQSNDIEQEMRNRGYNRFDSQRFIRTLLPMEENARSRFIEAASKAAPGMVRNNNLQNNTRV
jgi:hypothetical protein